MHRIVLGLTRVRVARFEDFIGCVALDACKARAVMCNTNQFSYKACLVCVFVSEVCGAVSTFDCIWQVRYSVVVVLIEELGLRFANIRTNAAAT